MKEKNITEMDKVKKILFIGSKKIGVTVLEKLYELSPKSIIGIMTIDDSSDTRTVFQELFHFANKYSIPLYVAESKPASEKIIKKINPDLCFVVGWYWLITESMLSSVPGGFIGIHNSLLPKYRGGAPLVWSLINDEKEVGLSIFSFSQGMDDGRIWVQKKVLVEISDFISDVLIKIEKETILALQEVYLKILSGDIEPVEQNHNSATYCSQRQSSDGIINWNLSSKKIYNFIRAQSDPYPGAFSYYNGNQCIVWKAKMFDEVYYGIPGQILQIANDGIYVSCGDQSALILEEIELCGVRGEAVGIIKTAKHRFSGHAMQLNHG